MEEGSLGGREQLSAVVELAGDLEPAPPACQDPGSQAELAVDRDRLPVADRDPRRHGREAMPGREQPAGLVEGRADDPAVDEPRAALVLEPKGDRRLVPLGADRGRQREPQAVGMNAAPEAGGIVRGRDLNELLMC